MATLDERLGRGEVIILDGAIGTELERRGAAMDKDAWCARATQDIPDLVRAVHEDYIRAGADVITVNTFSSARHVLEAAGLGDAVAEINTRAVALAREARDRVAADRPIAVAGSISTYVSGNSGFQDPAGKPPPDQARANFSRACGASGRFGGRPDHHGTADGPGNGGRGDGGGGRDGACRFGSVSAAAWPATARQC